MPTPQRRNAVRIIAGRYRGRRLHFPDLADLRPTPDRARETLFQWLQADLVGSVCLDLFAGSGALGFEALSRGANTVTLVDVRTAVVAALAANRDALGATADIVRADVRSFLARAADAGQRYDIIFLDPPYRSGLLASALHAALQLLTDDGAVYFESSAHAPAPTLPADFADARQARVGAVAMHLVRRRQTDASGGATEPPDSTPGSPAGGRDN